MSGLENMCAPPPPGGGSAAKFYPESSALRLTWDQAVFSFRFENNIPVGKAKRKAVAVRENVWEPLKLGLISRYLEGQLLTLLYNMFWDKRYPSLTQYLLLTNGTSFKYQV